MFSRQIYNIIQGGSTSTSTPIFLQWYCYLFEFLRFVALCSYTFLTYFSFKWEPSFPTAVNYLQDKFSENLDVTESKLERVVFELFVFVTRRWSLFLDDGFEKYGGYGGFKIILIPINISEHRLVRDTIANIYRFERFSYLYFASWK